VLEHPSPVADAPMITLGRFVPMAFGGHAVRSQSPEGRVSRGRDDGVRRACRGRKWRLAEADSENGVYRGGAFAG